MKKTKTMMKKKSGSKTSPQFHSHDSPNYMKPTASDDARRKQPKVSKSSIPQTSHENSSSQRKKGSTDSPTFRNVQADRATCSSTLKDSRFHGYLKLHPESEGTSDVKVCRYSYCSFNGHLHSLSPPLKSFVSERRRALKAKGNVNVRCQLPKANPQNCAEIRGRDEMCHDFGSTEDVKQIGDLNSKGKEIKSDERFGWLFDEIYGDGVSQESLDEESVNWGSVGLHSDMESLCSKKGSSSQGNQTTGKFSQSGGDATISCNATDAEKPNLKDKSPPNEDATTEIVNTSQASSYVEEIATFVRSSKCKATKHDGQDHNRAENLNGASTEDLKGEHNAVHGFNCRKTKSPDTEDKRVTVKSNKSPYQESDDPRRFNPRGPHLLDIEPEPGAEEVNLRHQELEARKKPEEWMVDYALRQAVKGGGSRRKVPLLVHAFERVVPKTRN